MQLVYLSYPLDVDGPRPPAIPAPSLEEFLRVESDQASVQKLMIYSHTGTHLDTSAHVFLSGEYIEDFTPEELIFRSPAVIDVPLPPRAVVEPEHLAGYRDRIAGADLLIVRFGYGETRAAHPADYCADCPGFGVAAAAWLRENFADLRCVGIDVPSFAAISDLANTMSAHNTFLKGRRMLILEEMKLDGDLSRLAEVRVNPWLVKGMHSGPCSVVGVLV